MTQIKTYIATIKITFDVHRKENPRVIAKHMASFYNGMRGANLHSYGEMEKFVEKTNVNKSKN